MAEQAELAFVKNLVSVLSAQPVTFANDFQQLPEHQLPKVQVLKVDPVIVLCGNEVRTCLRR